MKPSSSDQTLSTKKSIWKKLRNLFILLFLCQFLYLFICKWLDPPITITQLTNAAEGYGFKRDYISYNEMGRNIKLAVIASEDQLFVEHHGFDYESIKDAIEYNEKHPEKTRGASTISQQTAKNIFLWQHGGYFRKGLEVYFTFLIELFWSKKRILENYLNVVEMGKGIFGIQAASQFYFHKNASSLTMKEAAMIAACLPNPKKFCVVPTSRYVSARANHILQQMNNLSGDDKIEALLK